jgi:hypothetical protein
MALHRFDRQVFVELESTSGTLASVTAADFIDAIDPTFTITPRSYERNIVRPSFTQHPQYYSSLDVTTAASDTIAQVEMSFSVEMAAHSDGNTTEPTWGKLLKSCGFEALSTVARATIGAITNGPILHREEFEISTTPCGRAIGTTFTGDTSLFFDRSATAVGSLEATVSTATCTGASESTDVGHAYILNTDKSTATANTSVSIWMYLDGQMVVAKGCRGNVEFSFTATDRCLMNFTFTGVLDRFDNNESSITGASGGNKVAPVFSGAGFGINAVGTALDTSAIFSTLSIDMGNELIYRDDANAADGVKEVSIAGRAPTMSFNPDADLAGHGAYATWMSDFVTGALARAEFRLGAAAEDGNSFLFKMPALQWTGIADGDRDNLTVYEGSANLTGGTNGDSCRSSSDGTSRRYSDRGEDNELVIIAY